MDERQKAFDAFEKTGLVSVKAGLAANSHGAWSEFAQEWVALKDSDQRAVPADAATKRAGKPPAGK